MIMDCKRIKDELVAYLDGELGESAAAAVRGHLERCPACKLDLERLSAAGSILGEIRDIEPSADFTARTMRRALDAPQLRVSRSALMRRLVPAVAAAVVLVALGLWLLSPSGPESTESLDPVEMEIVENIDILENLELLEDLDLLSELDLLLEYEEEDFESS